MIAAQLTADIRARAAYMPPCPLCSHVGVRDFPDIIIYPNCREVRFPPSRDYSEGRTLHKFDPCCHLTRIEPQDSADKVARLWREARQQPLTNPSEESRRQLMLLRLQEKGHEPL